MTFLTKQALLTLAVFVVLASCTHSELVLNGKPIDATSTINP